MSTVDFVVAVIMILSVVLSILRGFTREVLTLVSLGGAVAAVYYGLPYIKPLFKNLFEDQTTASVAGGGITFFTVLIILSLLGHQIGKMVTKSGLGTVDRILGPVFGIARAMLLLCVLFVGLKWGYGDLPDAVKHAKSTPIIARTSDRLIAFLPPDIQAEIQPEKDKDKKKEEDGLAPAEKPVKPVGDVASPPPPPEKPGEPPAAPATPQAGYGNTERGDMNRLIGNESK